MQQGNLLEGGEEVDSFFECLNEDINLFLGVVEVKASTCTRTDTQGTVQGLGTMMSRSNSHSMLRETGSSPSEKNYMSKQV